MIIFLHIPKCAGAFVRDKIFRKNVNAATSREIFAGLKNKNFLSYYLENNEKVTTNTNGIVGHIPYGFHKIINDGSDKISYFTFLRDPVQRWLSNFYYYQNEMYVRKPWNEYSQLMKKYRNIDEFLKVCIKNGWSANQMIRQLSGSIQDIKAVEQNVLQRRIIKLKTSNAQNLYRMMKEYISRIFLSFKFTGSMNIAFRVYAKNTQIQSKYSKSILQKLLQILSSFKKNYVARLSGFDDTTFDIYGSYLQSEKYTNADYMDFLEAAKKNIQYFEFIGYVENMEIDIKALCGYYNWKYVKEEKRYNKTNYFRFNKVDISAETLSLIKELNKYDINFYNWVKANTSGNRFENNNPKN